MTKKNLIDLLKHRLAGGDCPQELKGKYHPKILEKHIEMSLNYLIKTVVFREAEQTKDYGMLDAFTKTFAPVKILYDQNRNERYSILPAEIVDLPMNRGIRLISDLNNQAVQFIYRSNNSVDMFSNLDVDRVISKPRFYREGNKVFYSRQLAPTVNEVLMKLIPNFSSLNDDDEVTIPQAYNKMIFDIVFQTMSNMPPEKLSNNNNPNIP